MKDDDVTPVKATLINAAQSIVGVSRARIVYFNISGNIGQVTKLTANDDQYFISNNVCSILLSF